MNWSHFFYLFTIFYVRFFLFFKEIILICLFFHLLLHITTHTIRFMKFSCFFAKILTFNYFYLQLILTYFIISIAIEHLNLAHRRDLSTSHPLTYRLKSLFLHQFVKEELELIFFDCFFEMKLGHQMFQNLNYFVHFMASEIISCIYFFILSHFTAGFDYCLFYLWPVYDVYFELEGTTIEGKY